MSKREEIISLIHQIGEIQEKKSDIIKNQQYEEAAKLRDEEKQLLEKLDDLSGVLDFYKKVYDTEKVLKHIELIINSSEQLKKLRPNFFEALNEIDLQKALVKLYKQRDEAYVAMVQIKDIMN